jgi:hypothetical protein
VLDLRGKEAEQGKGEERSGAERNERVAALRKKETEQGDIG